MRRQPIAYVWKTVSVMNDHAGVVEMRGAMVPAERYEHIAAREFAEGEEYILEISSERSQASHKQYFAALNDAWMNLPEEQAKKYPTPEHFRHRLLIAADFCDVRWIACSDSVEAKKTALFMRELDAFAVIATDANAVVVKRAKSQSRKDMGKEEFERSKRAVLDLAEQFTGVPRGQAMKHAGRSA